MPANGRVKSLYGRRCAIVTGHHAATRAAETVVGAGGSLVDAMVCASAVLTVALPHTSSLGGCAMAMLHGMSTGGIAGLNGSGRAPAAATLGRFADGMPQRGGAASVTPTLVRFWARAHERHGVLPLPQLLRPAIALAQCGCPAAEELVRNLDKADAGLRSQPGFAHAFAPDGQWLRRGAIHRQPRLAAVLQEIATRGEEGFYRGWVADSLLEAARRAGGLLAPADFETAQADWVESWSGVFRGHAVHVMPPNSMGALMLGQLAAWGDGDVVQEIRAALAIIAAGQQRIGDAGRTPLTLDQLGADRSQAPALRAQPGDTTGFVAMDDTGAAVAMLQSVFQPFGSGCVDPGTGILLNNRMFEFSSTLGHANQVAPGMRPAHTLNPYLVVRDGKLRLAGVSPGGVSQTTTGAQVLRGVLGDDQPSLGEVVSRDRWSLGRDGTVLLEPGVPAQVAQRLRAQGLRVTENSSHEFYFGSAKLVRAVDGGVLEAAADPRRQAHATAW